MAVQRGAVGCSGKSESKSGSNDAQGQTSKESQGAAIAAIKKLGGRVVSVSKNSGKANYVFFNSTNVTDAGLVPLKALTNLHNLDLSETKITDAGLVHLKGLTKLQYLYLVNTKVGDAGLAHLKGLTKLKILDISDTKVTIKQPLYAFHTSSIVLNRLQWQNLRRR